MSYKPTRSFVTLTNIFCPFVFLHLSPCVSLYLTGVIGEGKKCEVESVSRL